MSTDAVIVWWDGFSEWTGTSLLYEVRLLEEGGMGSEVNWTSVSTAKMVSLRGLQVAENTTAHLLQIRALNLGGVASQPISINISIISVAPLDTGNLAALNLGYFKILFLMDRPCHQWKLVGRLSPVSGLVREVYQPWSSLL